ncbi:MAG: alpha-amylase, partial [Muribaculaceae bacterium]|nr:alpha-amylase [Muribaculaceae bacterium]
LRYTKESVLLIIVNFDHSESDVDVVIPRLAFEMSGLPESYTVADDLLCGRSAFLQLIPDKSVRVHLNPKDAMVLRVK